MDAHAGPATRWRDGVAHAVDWWAIIFNPSMPYRLTHMLLASGLTAAFLVAGLSAWRWLNDQRTDDVMIGVRTGITMAAVLIPVQIFVGDLHGLNTLEHQPAKVAAMEANWETRGNVPLVLFFAIPNERERRNDFEIAIPNGASLILKHQRMASCRASTISSRPTAHGPTRPSRRCSSPSASWSASGADAACLMDRRLPDLAARRPQPASRMASVAMTFSGWIATLAGWYVTEIGRQPCW